MPTALIVEDEDGIASFIRRGLEAEGFTVITTGDGREGLSLARSSAIDVMVLDLMLPGMRGEDVLERLRERRPDLPVIVLTAKDAVADRVANLHAGADDYMTKPFSLAELVARIRARLRTPAQGASAVLAEGRVTLDLRSREARTDDRIVDLTAREFSLLETFMRHPGQVLTQPQLLDQAWGYEHDPGSNVVEVYVGYLRRKLGVDVIQTVRGAGYRFRG
ncbi:MAG TPA: response regulator transcription factor [Actinomycetota bacterium]|nr:response regulator transcription factor [Actinomycetota bacterium]